MRTIVRSLWLGSLFAGAVVSCAQAADKVVYQLDWLPGGDKAPIYVCIHKGFCAEAGLEVSIEGGRGSSEAITKLATEVSDIGSAGIGAVMSAKAAEDVPVTAVMSLFNKGPHAFYALAGSGFEQIEDVKGKDVATSPFTESNIYLPLVLDDLGMTEGDIKLTKADPGALGPMLMTGASDVIIAWLTDISRYTAQAREAGKELVIIPWSAAGLELYSASLVASDKFLAERPDVARRFVSAYKKSIAYAHENPRDAAEAVVAAVPELSIENVEGSLKDAMALVYNEITDKDGLGAFEPDRLQATWERVSKAQGLDPASLDPEGTVDRSFDGS